jgi:hypothetical protein
MTGTTDRVARRVPRRREIHEVIDMADESQAGVDQAPDPDSDEFLDAQNTAERVSPGTTADAPSVDADLISTEPGGGPGEETDQVRAKDRKDGEN